jgi:hypothetical protein
LEFTPSGPRDLIDEFVVRIADVCFDFVHFPGYLKGYQLSEYLAHRARVERLELPANGFGDRYSTIELHPYIALKPLPDGLDDEAPDCAWKVG